MTETVKYSWTQPCCLACFMRDNPGRYPVRFRPEHCQVETCVQCGIGTDEGIYIRTDPKTAAFPTIKDDD